MRSAFYNTTDCQRHNKYTIENVWLIWSPHVYLSVHVIFSIQAIWPSYHEIDTQSKQATTWKYLVLRSAYHSIFCILQWFHTVFSFPLILFSRHEYTIIYWELVRLCILGALQMSFIRSKLKRIEIYSIYSIIVIIVILHDIDF